MKNNRAMLCIIFVFLSTLLSACSNSPSTVLEMEMTQDYDISDPFVNAKLIYVSDDADSLDLDASFQMEGESGILEILDNETAQVIWSNTWSGNVENTNFIISLDSLEKEQEYAVRFTGTGIKYAKIVITSDNSLVKERERPQKPSKS